MIALGGWIFADLLLGLAMLFFTANTVGLPPPTPTPLPTPNLLATERARSSAQLAMTGATATAAAAAAAQTAEALGSEVAESDVALATAAARATREALRLGQLTATSQAEATRAAMSDSARATADAQATRDAIAAEATVAAFATARAQDRAEIDTVLAEAATAAAQSTSIAATAVAVQTEAASVALVATARAQQGDDALAAALATNEALAAAGLLNENDLATARAQSTAVAGTVEALRAEQSGLQVTATALANAVLAGSLNSTARTATISIDAQGLLDRNPRALDDARGKLREVMAQYPPPDCRVGFVLISANATGLGNGVEIANRIQDLLFEEFPDQFIQGQTGVQPFWSGNADPYGQVDLEMFFYQGCSS